VELPESAREVLAEMDAGRHDWFAEAGSNYPLAHAS
jgi:hypothetical protein